MCGPTTVFLAGLKGRHPESEIAGGSRGLTQTKSGKPVAGEMKKIPTLREDSRRVGEID
jgi:hypothetical protein